MGKMKKNCSKPLDRTAVKTYNCIEPIKDGKKERKMMTIITTGKGTDGGRKK